MIERLHLWTELAFAERLWWTAAIAFFVAAVLLLGVRLFDDGLFGTESVWAKPLKFALSTSLHFGTVALATHFIRPAFAESWWLSAIALISVAAAVFEVGCIALQAGRGLLSHFNVSTPADAAI